MPNVNCVAAVILAGLLFASREARPSGAVETVDQSVPLRHAAGTVSGQVVAPASLAPSPLPGAKVTLRRLQSDAAPQTVVAGQDGTFELDGVPAGRYVLSADKGGYVPMAYGALRYGEAGVTVVVAPGQSVGGLRLVLPRGAVLTGTVQRSGGRPAARVSVSLMQPGISRDDGVHRLQPVADDRSGRTRLSVRTDETGAFRLFGVPAGRYAVRFSWMDRTAGLVAMFYPGTPDPAGAELVSVAAGAERRITVTLPDVATVTASLAGVVSGSGVALGNVRVRVRAARSGEPFGASTTADSAGRFLIPGLIAGPYTLDARVVGRASGTAGDQQAVWSQTEVVVPAGGASGAQVTLLPGMTFAGHVAFGPGARQPADPSQIEIALTPMSPWQADLPIASRVGVGGRFRLEGLAPGRYRVSARTPDVAAPGEQVTVASISLEGGRVLDDWIEIAPDEHLSNAVVELADRGQTVVGTLRGADNLPAIDLTVVVFPSDPPFRVAWSRRIRAARPATDGGFRFDGLPAGDYRLIALRDPDPDELLDPAFLASLQPQSMAIALAPGEHKVLDLRVSRIPSVERIGVRNAGATCQCGASR